MEYVEFTQRRALWQEIGMRPEELTAREMATYSLFIRLEQEKRKNA